MVERRKHKEIEKKIALDKQINITTYMKVWGALLRGKFKF